MKTVKSLFEYEPPERRQLGLVTRCLLILPPAFLLSLKYDLPHILILTTLMVLFPLFQDRSFRLRDRPIIYSILAAAILAIVPGLFVKIPPERLTFSDYLMRSHQFLPFLLYASAISCWFMRTREISALCMLIVLLSCLSCGDVYNTAKLVNVSFAGTTSLLRNYRLTYLVCTFLQCIGTLLLLTADVRYDSVNSLSFMRTVRWLAVILLVPAFCGAFLYFNSLEETFRDWRSRIQHYVQQPPSGPGNVFPTETPIRMPLFEEDTPVRVIMQAISPSAPGYLRGNVYRGFSGTYGGIWVADEKNTTDVVEITREEDRNLAVLTFLLQDSGDSDTDCMEFRFASDFRNIVTPLPANATSVTLDAKSAVFTRDGGLIAENWNPSSGVIVTFNAPDPMSAYQEPTDHDMAPGQEVRQDYLRLPPMLADQLAVLTDEIFGDVDPTGLTPQDRIGAVVRFFADKFEYSLRRDDYIPSRREYYSPLMRFLFTRRAGHCELFATAAALLLRQYGIPTRYVAGVVCNRYNKAGYYYATNFDLHAWVEAWIDDEQKWVLVEATPPGNEIDDILAAASEDSWLRDFRDRIAFKYDNMVYWFRRGYLAQVIIQAWDDVYQWTRLQFSNHPVRSVFALLVPLSLVVSAVVYLRNRRRKRYAMAWQIRRLARMMRSLQLAVWRKTDVQRELWQTYSAWAKAFDDPALNECVALYERIRYAGRMPLPEEVTAFEEAVRTVRRHMPRRKKRGI
jgi:uncharacterized membrane protein (DUF373 family)